ncbi:type II secretion system protein F [Intrasporangium chromatireducens Q5-1]|uniref:Type II secretion system protein F n=1 Tax=Intrasporangium chromatireducens Q5-1 TaxID=584657 RepID=W9GS47_9MICO|nr:type II secretion system protein F [Intrasporangium chromatireducens Q5-1]
MLAVGASAGLLLGTASAASADSAPIVSISDVKTSGSTVQGVLTFRSAGVVQVDEGTFVAAIDGKATPASITKATHIDRTAMLVIDTSGSMGAPGMATVRAATKSYLQEAPADVRIGVVTFADTAGVDLKPTENRSAVQRVVNGLASRGDTSLYAAVQDAVAALGTEGDRSIVLLSDGGDTVSKNRQAELGRTTEAVRKAGIRVDVVRFRTNDPDASAALSQFAGASGGSVIAADNAEAVGAAFQTAARALKSQAAFQIQLPAPLGGAHAIRLSGTVQGQPFSISQKVDFGAAAAVPTPQTPRGSPSVASPPSNLAMAPSRMPWIASSILGVAIFLLAFGILTPKLQTRRERRLATIEAYVAPIPVMSRSETKGHPAPLSEQLVDLGERAMKGRKSTARTLELINRADLPLKAGEWFVLTVIAVVVGAALGAILAGTPALGLPLGAILGAVLPQLTLRILASRRASAFERVLPQSLLLVSTGLKSGFGLPQALDSLSRDGAEPVAKEVSRALAETRIGTDIADALDHVTERMGSKAMSMAVMAIRIQREVGGNLAETLETTAHTLREREALYRQVRTLSAEGRLSSYILIGLPIGLFFYMLGVNYGYVSLLWTTGIGLGMLAGGIIMLGLGIVWMRKVVRIEV